MQRRQCRTDNPHDDDSGESEWLLASILLGVCFQLLFSIASKPSHSLKRGRKILNDAISVFEENQARRVAKIDHGDNVVQCEVEMPATTTKLSVSNVLCFGFYVVARKQMFCRLSAYTTPATTIIVGVTVSATATIVVSCLPSLRL